MHRTLLVIMFAIPGCLLGQSAAPSVDASKPVPMAAGKTVQSPAAGQAGVGVGQANGNEVSALKTQSEVFGGGTITNNSSGIVYALVGAGTALTFGLVYALIRMARAVWVGVEVGKENTDANRDTHSAVTELTGAVRLLTVEMKSLCRGCGGEFSFNRNGSPKSGGSGAFPAVTRPQHSAGAQV